MTRHLAASGIAQCFLGVAILAMSCQAAMADATTLICDNDIYPNFPPSTIVINEAGHTVIMNDGKNLGPLAAVFDSGKITFTEVVDSNGDPQNTWNYTLDRLTGNLSMITDSGAPFPKMATCHAGKAQF